MMDIRVAPSGGPGLKRSIKKYRPVRTVSLRVVCTDNLKAFRRAFFEDSQYLTEVHTTLCTMFNVDPQVTRQVYRLLEIPLVFVTFRCNVLMSVLECMIIPATNRTPGLITDPDNYWPALY